MVGAWSSLKRWIKGLRRRIAGRNLPPMRASGSDAALIVPFGFDPPVADRKRAVMVHLFHADLGGFFRELAGHIPGRVDLLISTDTAAKAEALKAAFAGWTAGTTDIRLVPNRGRDMAPKFIAFADLYPRYDQILFLHSKKSSYLRAGQDWRDVLVRGLVGSGWTVRSILAMFEADDRLGIVFPQHYDGIRDRLAWGSNGSCARQLCHRMGVPLHRAQALDFASGSMFWARPAALAPLLALGLAADDFAPEAGQIDGTLAHAIERVLLYVAETAGFSWLKTADPDCYEDRSRLIRVATPDELRARMDEAGYRLLVSRRGLKRLSPGGAGMFSGARPT